MTYSAWKATLQNGLQIEIDYSSDDDRLDVHVGSEDHGWQWLEDVEDRTPAKNEGDKLEIDRIWVATRNDGSQILINYWHQTYFQKTAELTVAYRQDRWLSWSAPVTATANKGNNAA